MNNGGFMFLYSGNMTFLMFSLKETLEKKGLETDKCELSVKELSILRGFPYAFIVDAAALNQNSEARTYLFDLCIERTKKVVLVGDREEIDHVLKGVSQKIIAATFARPINNFEACERMVKLSENAKFDSQKKKILVVDDSAAFLRTISAWLENDYIVNICPSATAAFHMIELFVPDLILLDYEMPVCSGAQFLQMLRSEKHSAKIPVIFLTSRSDPEAVKSVLSLHPQGYLLKSLPKDQILTAIENFFYKREQ